MYDDRIVSAISATARRNDVDVRIQIAGTANTCDMRCREGQGLTAPDPQVRQVESQGRGGVPLQYGSVAMIRPIDGNQDSDTFALPSLPPRVEGTQT